MSTETQNTVEGEVLTATADETSDFASQVIVDQRGVVMAIEDKTNLEQLAAEINTFLETNKDVTALTAEQKDVLYNEVTEKWNVYQRTLRGVEYNYFASKKEYRFLRGLIMNQMSYGANEIFVAIRVRDNFISSGDKAFMATTSKVERASFKVKIDDLTITYHLIEKYQVKGLNEESILFANTLKTIGDISIIFNSFDKNSKQLSEQIGNWMAGLDAPDAVVAVATDAHDTVAVAPEA